MNKAQTKRFAFLAILMSLLLAVTAVAFALMGVRKAKADGETELTFGREISSSAWVKNEAYAMSYVDVPVAELAGSVVTADIHNGLTDSDGNPYIKIVRGAQSYNAGNVYCEYAMRIYFNGTGYYGDGAQNGDQLVIGAGFSVTVSGTTYICTEGVSWTFDGTSWKADWEEEQEDLSGYTDMNVTGMTTAGVDTPFVVITDSASQTVDENNVAAVLPYVSMRFPDGTPATIWFCRVNKEQARFFVRTKDDPNANINAGQIPVGSLFTVKRGFRLDEVSALKEDVTFIYKASGFMKVVPATAITVENEGSLSLNNGATLQLKVALTPADSSDDIVYTALDNGVTVSASGLVTGKEVGNSQIKITAGNIEKTVTITVKTPPTVNSISVVGKLEIYQYEPITTLSQSDSAIAKITGQYNYSDDTTDTFPITKDMISGWNAVNTDVAADYTVTVTKDGKEADLTVTVKQSTVLTLVDSGYDTAWSSMRITFSGSQADYQFNNPNVPPADKAAVMAKMVSFLTVNLKNYTSGNLELEMQMNYSPAAGQRTINIYWHVNYSAVAFSRGDTVTLKKGFPVLATDTVSERIAEEITFVFNGSQWVKLVEATALSISNKETLLYKNVPFALQITTDPANATGILSFVSNHPDYASVNEQGVITPLKLTDDTVSEVTVTVSYKDLSDTITFTIENEPVKTAIEIEDKILYYVPVNSSFTEAGYELYYHFVYDDGQKSGQYSVNVAEIDEAGFDFTTPGDRPLTITVEGFSDTVTVHVYELKTLGWWQDIGVSGYGDDRNQAGEFNGNMLVTARNFSSSAANITGQVVDVGVTELGKMFDYITYYPKNPQADGPTEYTRANGKLGGWLLGSTILINAGGKGFTGAPENGYQLGDKITFGEGMPLYGWSGELDTQIDPNDKSTPKAGTGCMYVIGYLDADYTYFCYDQNDTYSMWLPYVEYTDFTVSESISITVNGAGSLGAKFTPADSTTGQFTYVSSDKSVVTVSENGNLVGVKEGTATITVKALPLEASGFEKDEIVKVVSVTVKKGIASVTGSFKVKPNAKFDLDKNKITVTYTDGTTEEIALSDDRVQAEEVDTSVKGESTYLVMVNIDGTQKRGTFTVNVKSGGCGSFLAGGSVLLGVSGFVFAIAVVLLRRKKEQS